MQASDPPRVAEARRAKEKKLTEMSRKIGIPYPAPEILIRAFKGESELEIWAAPKKGAAMKLLTSYKIAAQSGELGPKRKQGDRQVPEGFYHIERFNPQSRFLLSLGLNYPNGSDQKLSDKEKPGGDIFIHGDQKSIGCLAMTDDKIQEIYLIAYGARKAGQARIPVHIYPMRMTRANAKILAEHSVSDPALSKLWAQLQKGYDAFEATKRPPKIAVSADGAYRVTKVQPSSG
ncbi:MAG: L,D-transpeptidase family protein [Fimbriimonadaceae bacterium]|nr:L,D-transpeptidase family protein [Fimbriimonadaceae bacterium]